MVSEHSGLPEHLVDECGLPVIYVRNDGDITDLHLSGPAQRRRQLNQYG
jgi:hypothetical protein